MRKKNDIRTRYVIYSNGWGRKASWPNRRSEQRYAEGIKQHGICKDARSAYIKKNRSVTNPQRPNLMR
jgi:hypothetical protein